jgi:chorismate mutase
VESRIRAFRGATTVDQDDPQQIRDAVRLLVLEMLDKNELVDDDLVDVILTVTPDLTSMYAGTALREECGFHDVPLLGAVEANVTIGVDRCVRVMLHAYSPRSRGEVVHVFHGESRRLRPDLNAADTAADGNS